MQILLRDIFRDVITKAREGDVWEKATPKQLELLVSRYLLQHYSRCKRVQAAEPVSRDGGLRSSALRSGYRTGQ